MTARTISHSAARSTESEASPTHRTPSLRDQRRRRRRLERAPEDDAADEQHEEEGEPHVAVGQHDRGEDADAEAREEQPHLGREPGSGQRSPKSESMTRLGRAERDGAVCRGPAGASGLPAWGRDWVLPRQGRVRARRSPRCGHGVSAWCRWAVSVGRWVSVGVGGGCRWVAHVAYGGAGGMGSVRQDGPDPARRGLPRRAGARRRWSRRAARRPSWRWRGRCPCRRPRRRRSRSGRRRAGRARPGCRCPRRRP